MRLTRERLKGCGMLHLVPRGLGPLLIILYGCAANNQSPVGAEEREPDCSFRSPVTCWSVGARFPSRPKSPPQPDGILSDTSTSLATLADSVRRSAPGR